MEPVGRPHEEWGSEAEEFVRFCYRRRRVGWPEMYDEMCAVAGHGLYQGWTHEDLAERGIGFSLSQMPALAALVRHVVEQESPRRRDRATYEAADRDRSASPAEEDGAGVSITRVTAVTAMV